MARFGQTIVRRRRLVLVFWLVATIAGIAVIGKVTSRLSSSSSLPGLSSYEASQAILHRYGTGGENPPDVLVLRLPPGERVESAAGRSALASSLAPLTRDRSLRVASYATTGDPRLVGRDGTSAVALVFGGNNEPTSEALAQRVRASVSPGTTVAETSLGDLESGSSGGGLGVLAETVVGGIGALIVLSLVFGSALAILPLIGAIVSIIATFLLIGAVTTVAPVSILVEYLIALIGLGVAIDYSLLVITRWREERARGRPNHEAVVAAVATAGRSVAFSGVTVGVGLLTLVALPIPFVRSLGYAGVLIPIVSVVVAVTLLPAVLATVGPRLDWPHRRRSAQASRSWTAWTKGIVRHRLLATVAGAAVLGVLFGAAFGLRAGLPRPSSLASSGPAFSGLRTLEHDGLPVGLINPIEVLMPDAGNPASTARLLADLPGAYTAIAPAGAQWRRDGTALVDVVPSAATTAPANSELVADVRRTLPSEAPGAQVSGVSPVEIDVVHALYGRGVLVLGLLVLASLLTLALAFRSVLLPLKALVLNALSIGATCGALVLVWQHGVGSHSIWGIPATGAVVDFVPLLVFAFLFGLSMDYEVFIVSRIKEAHDAGASTDDAVVTGVARTGRLVTSAAAVLVLAFVALGAGPDVSLKMFATGLAFGIFLDATVVRCFLVPALVSLLGERSWWFPRRRRRELVAPATTALSTRG